MVWGRTGDDGEPLMRFGFARQCGRGRGRRADDGVRSYLDSCVGVLTWNDRVGSREMWFNFLSEVGSSTGGRCFVG